MSILIVDDNPVNLTIIEKILHNEGYRDCILLQSASELFDYLRIDSPETSDLSVDLILLDMMMPEIDGIQACHQLGNGIAEYGGYEHADQGRGNPMAHPI